MPRVYGLRAWELRDVEADGLSVAAGADTIAARVEVRDGSGRFHDFRIAADLPSDGLLANPCGNPPVPAPEQAQRYMPLFSLPSRPVPPGFAVVRARLLYEEDRRPAAYAALEVVARPGAQPVRGIADERGEVLVLFPYPPPLGLFGSPPAGTKRPLAQATWTVTLQVLAPTAEAPADGRTPDLCTFLDQSPATLVTTTSPPAEIGEATVQYGRELVLRSSQADSALLVRP
ncbi:MAG: hypothetical protein H0X64_11600 [Gemmatimonadaceae bacterium]|nr:hypothetical protein [Gemmatimonadaceae bacterium]